jgi:type III secretion system FlhB-like substrate exporter
LRHWEREWEREREGGRRELIGFVTGIEERLDSRLATALSKLAYSSERTIAIILSSSVSVCWLLCEVELDEAPSSLYRFIAEILPLILKFIRQSTEAGAS